MNNKPDTATLMSYLYGELDPVEQAKVAKWLASHPAEAKEWEGLKETRFALKQYPSISVTPPVMILPEPQKKATIIGNGWARKWAAVAAGLSLLLLALSWAQVQVKVEDQQLSIRFGNPSPETTVNVPAEEPRFDQLHNWVAMEMNKQNDSLLNMLIAMENGLQQKINQRYAKLERNADRGITAEQLEKVIENLQEENREQMLEILALSQEYQKVYTQQLFIDFSEQLSLQRFQDLEAIEGALNYMVAHSDQKQETTDLILAQLITSLNQSR